MARNFQKIFFDILKYGIALSIAIALLWYVYRDLDFASIIGYFANINYWWLGLSVFIAIASHYVRAYRWNMMFEPLGYQLKTPRTFVAVMVGYFANNLVPRLGEVTRCGLLKRTDGVAMTSAFGTVVAERALDLIILLMIALGTFILEFDKLYDFILGNFGEYFPDQSAFNRKLVNLFILSSALLAFGFLLLRVFKERLKRTPLFIKIRKIARELLEGFLSIRKIKRQWTFWFLTVLIWVMYYTMLIIVFFAFPSTSYLSFAAGLTVLVMSGFGMSAPVQGGIGVFHILVSSVLVLYGVSPEAGKMFALIAHSMQFLSVMVVGGISFIISFFMKKRNSFVGQQ